MDYSFYTLVAICIFLLTLTFYLAVRRRRQTVRRQVQDRDSEERMISSRLPCGPGTMNGTSAMPQQDLPNPMTTRLSLSPSFPVNKPEDNMPQIPPPSYQDYTKDVRLVYLPAHQ
ncbi:hypothetical protein [Absidia glauca]|uniref:Uncharacterized protein n=1 Tax=Absidia glauca TaxID=4829 RepID=A0A168LC26_ABSGL|nr:hypothetical protein [Absidia glauca]